MISKALKLGPAALAIGFLAASPVTAQNAPRTAEAALESWVAALDALPEIEARFEELTGRGSSATLTGLSILGPEMIIAFEPIRVTSYRGIGESGFAFGSFEVDRVQARTPTTEVNVVGFAVTEISVPDTGFTFDAEQPISSILDIWGKADDIVIDEIAIDRIDIGQFQGGLNAVISYHDYVIAGWENGRIETSTAGPLVMQTPSPDELVMLTVDELISEDLDINALIRVLDPAAYTDGDREWRTFLGHTEYNNIILDAPDIRMRIRSIEVDDIAMRQAGSPFTPMLERLLTESDLPALEADAMLEEILLDLISPWRLGGFSIMGLDIYADEVDRFHIGEFYLSDLSLDGLGEIGLADVDLVAGGDIDFRMDRLALGGIEMADEAVIQSILDAIAAGQDPDNITDLVPMIGFIETAGIELAIDGMLPLALDRMLIAADGYVGPIPTGNRIEVQGLRVPQSVVDGQVRAIINQLGFTEFIVDLGMAMTWNEADETLLLEDVHFAIRGAGSISASLELGGVTRALLTDPDTMSETDVLTLTFNGARLAVVDRGVADALFAFTAENTDVSVEQYRDEFIRGLPFLLSVSMDRAIALEISPALQEFLRQPSSLIVEAVPEDPIPLAALAVVLEGSPFALIDILGAELSVEPLE